MPEETQPPDEPSSASMPDAGRARGDTRGLLAAIVCPQHGELDASWALCPHCLRSTGARTGTLAVATKPGSSVAPTISRYPAALLVVQQGGQVGCAYRVAQDGTTLGRDPHNTIVLSHPGISRFHARIVCRDGELLLMDLGSTNGTYVNGRRVDSVVALVEGDEVRLGGITLSLRQVAPPTDAG
jgi:hypothetical protein